MADAREQYAEGDDEYEEEEEDDEDYVTEEESEESTDAEEDDLEAAEDWQGRKELPAPTWEALTRLVARMTEAGQTELTILIIGKQGMGKSSTANSLLCERAAELNSGITAVGQGGGGAQVFVRRAGEFVLKIIDTPGLVQGAKVNQAAFKAIASAVSSRRVDAVLYVDRLDIYRVDPIDRQVLRAVTQHFGKSIWKRTILVLTRGHVTMPAGYDFATFRDKRVAALAGAVKKAGGPSGVPAVVLDNSSRCKTNELQQKVLPDGTVWMESLMGQVVEVALQRGQALQLKYRPFNPNRSKLWLLPLLVLAQVAVKRFVLDPVVEADGWRGDRHGMFDPDTMREQKLLAESRKRIAQREEERRKQVEENIKRMDERKSSSLASKAAKSAYRNVEYDDDDGYDD